MGKMIQGIILTPLKIIDLDDGNVMHAMRNTDQGFSDFGEVYFSEVYPGRIKAWKRHNKMTLNLVVPIGEVHLVCYDDRADSESFGLFTEISFLKNNYGRLTIPPQIWFGFKGLSREKALIINIANIMHDPHEIDRKSENAFNYCWEKI